MDTIKIVLADDHAVVRSGLRLLLEAQEDMEVVGEAQDGMEAVEKARALQPDVILMDITMPRLNGLEAARQIRRESQKVGILFLTMHQNEEYFFQSLKVGGAGYIPKSAQDVELVSAIKTVAEGRVYLHPSVAKFLVSDYLERARAEGPTDPYESLTEREQEILHLVASGHSNKDIADMLHLSIHTVHNHRTSLMEKLGMHSRLDIMKYAIRKGLISQES